MDLALLNEFQLFLAIWCRCSFVRLLELIENPSCHWPVAASYRNNPGSKDFERYVINIDVI